MRKLTAGSFVRSPSVVAAVRAKRIRSTGTVPRHVSANIRLRLAAKTTDVLTAMDTGQKRRSWASSGSAAANDVSAGKARAVVLRHDHRVEVVSMVQQSAAHVLRREQVQFVGERVVSMCLSRTVENCG